MNSPGHFVIQKKRPMKRLSLILALSGILTNAYTQSTLIWFLKYLKLLLKFKLIILRITGRRSDLIDKSNWPKNTSSGQRWQVVKYDLNGDTLSTMIYGNDSLYDNTLIDYKFDSTNHVYLLQREYLGYYKSKIVLQKYALNGTLVWSEQIQNLADTSYRPLSLALVNDTCLFMTAYKEYDYPEYDSDVEYTTSISHLYAYHSNGNLLWQRVLILILKSRRLFMMFSSIKILHFSLQVMHLKSIDWSKWILITIFS